MKKFLFSLLAVGIALSCGIAQSEENAKTPQQNKMAVCNRQAVGKCGDERKGLLQPCLSAQKEAKQAKR